MRKKASIKEMPPENKDDIRICPHCGYVHISGADLSWDEVGDTKPAVCRNCKNPFDDDPSSGASGEEKTKARKSRVVFVIVAVLLTALLIYLNRSFNAFASKGDTGQIIYAVLLVLIISSSLASGKIWQKLKYLLIWAAIFLVFVTGYSYRYELAGVKDRVMAQFMPSKGFQEHPGSISFSMSSDGHFYIRAQIEGTPVIFLADTGASGIVLSPQDARRLGIEPDQLDFNRLYETANGVGRGSSIQIADLRIGHIHMDQITASVNEADMRNSLLGMTFFNRLKSYEVKNGLLTLYGDGQ